MSGFSFGINLGVVSGSVATNPNMPSGIQPTVCVNAGVVSGCYTPQPPGQNIQVTSIIVGTGYMNK